MCQLLSGVYSDTSISLERRDWVYERWGTSIRAMYSMMEITFSTSWPYFARPLFEEVDSRFVIFFILYIPMVVFAILGIMAALFLRETLARAAADAEQGIRAKMKETK